MTSSGKVFIGFDIVDFSFFYTRAKTREDADVEVVDYFLVSVVILGLGVGMNICFSLVVGWYTFLVYLFNVDFWFYCYFVLLFILYLRAGLSARSLHWECVS